jgi:predicted Zn-dependent protease
MRTSSQILRGVVVGIALLGGMTGELAGQEAAQRARELVRAGRAAEAVPIYESLVAATPDDAGLRLNLAIAHFTAKQYEQAIRQCTTVLADRPALTGGWLFLGASRFQLGQFPEAIPALEKVVAALPEERNARLMLAEALLRQGRDAEAVTHFELLASSLADNPRVWYGLERGYSAVAEAAVEELERGAADPAYAHALRGDRLREQGFYGQAFFHYRQAMALRPDLPGLEVSIREIYLATGHDEWAAALEGKTDSGECGEDSPRCSFLAGRYKAALAETASGALPEALYWRARAARALASEALERLSALPPSAQAYEIRARKLERQANHSEAIENWRKALEVSPGNPVLEQGLAVSLHGNRDFETALPLLEKLRAHEPESAELRFLEGSALLGMGRAEKAVPQLVKAVELRPDFTAARGELGRAYLQLGKAEQAIPHLEGALPEDEDGSRRFQLVRAYRAAGRAEEADEALAEYQEFKRAAEGRARELQAQFEIIAPE